jgi:hypothetical protein
MSRHPPTRIVIDLVVIRGGDAATEATARHELTAALAQSLDGAGIGQAAGGGSMRLTIAPSANPARAAGHALGAALARPGSGGRGRP